jgi:poly-gamma-glutamate synthesis protein (capsule biosynthesis protein)
LRAAGNWRAGLNSAVSRRLSEDIQAIRNQVDWVVVNYCWNQDLAEYPAEWQVKLARLAIDEGADLVVGHHPNVLQGAEIYKGRAIAYSLGNFVFADSQADPSTDYDTAVLKVSLRESGFAGTQARQMRIEFVPVQVRQSQPAIAVGENARRISQYMRQASGLFEQPLQSPTILDVRSAGDAPAIDPAPVEPPIAPANPLPPSDSFIAPPSTPASPDSFITEPELPPTRTKEIRLEDRQKPTEAQNVDDRHIVPPAAAPTEYQPSAPAPLEPAPVEATIDSIARLPAATPKSAIESPKPIETAIATVPTRTAIELSAIEPVSEPVSEPVVTAVPTVEATVDPANVPEADLTDPAASPEESPN